jgi:hypothetical protein
MNQVWTIGIGAVLALVLWSPSGDAQFRGFTTRPPVVLYAGPVPVAPDAVSVCSIVNVGTTNLARLVIRNYMQDQPETTVEILSLEPGIPVSRNNVNQFAPYEQSYCEFEFIGNPRDVRATMCVIADEGACQGAVTAE